MWFYIYAHIYMHIYVVLYICIYICFKYNINIYMFYIYAYI